MCQYCKLCKNSVTIDNEIKSKINMALADNIKTGYKHEIVEKKQSIYEHYYWIECILTDVLNEPNNTNDEICAAIVAETRLKLKCNP